MKLVLVRHGRPDEEDDLRPHDPGLRVDGLQQAEAVAELLARERITHIVASPLTRAAQTAQPLARRLGLPVHTIDGWAEADRHTSRYRSTETLRALGKTEWTRFLEDPIAYLGGDSGAFRAQVLQALDETIELGAGGQVAVFTHGLPINVVLSHTLGLEKIVHFQPGYGSVSRLRILPAPRRIGVVSVNESGHHLPVAAPTPDLAPP
ncbi:histidine phosphatase family protein [Variovorax paradoxus]|nr:histidine phosphatase family protein [Variovorax paradoxus]MBT2301971.1 histidine phosphatase family protein [Variovorax paradoxus]